MPFMKGSAPIRRTWQYLQKGDMLFKKNVQVVTINYNIDQKSSVGAYEFCFWEFPRLRYKNPSVQFLKFNNMTPSPFLQIYFDSGEKALVDLYGKTKDEIRQHIRETFCKTQEMLDAEKKEEILNPANFGPKFARHCICEIPGQVPCPSFVPLPEHMKGIKDPKKMKEEEDL